MDIILEEEHKLFEPPHEVLIVTEGVCEGLGKRSVNVVLIMTEGVCERLGKRSVNEVLIMTERVCEGLKKKECGNV